MIRRRLLTTLTAVAAALLGLLLILLPQTGEQTVPRTAPIPDGPYVPLDLPDTAVGPRPGDEFGQVGGASRYAIHRRTRDGRLVDFVGETYTPLPAGESLVGKPVARIELSPSRLVEIRADEARLVEQDRQPQHGTLRGNVRVTLYAGSASSGSPPRFGPESSDAVLRLFFDEPVEFDLLTGRIDSTGPVHATSRRFDLRGRGLTLRYNDLANRIEHMELAHGQELRVRATADAVAPTTPAFEGADGTGHDAAARSPRGQAGASSQGYHARFERLSHVRRGDVTLTGDVLEAFFALAAEMLADDALGDDDSEVAPTSPAAVVAEGATGVPAPADSASARAMMTPRDDDILIAWTGPLHLRPHVESIPRLDDEDVVLRLSGRPMRVLTSGRELATASTASYRTAEGLVELSGQAGLPVLITSSTLGMIECDQVRYSPRHAAATFRGPGRVRGMTGAPDGAHDTRWPPAAGQTQSMQVTWRDRLETSFYTDAMGATSRLTGLRHAVFHGHAEALHPQVRLSGEQLALHLGEPDAALGGRQPLRRIIVTDEARLENLDPRPDARVDIQAGELTIDWESIPGASGRTDQPVRLTATDRAVLRRPATRLFANQVTIDFIDPSDAATPIAPGPIHRDGPPPAADPRAIRSGDHADGGASWLASALSPQLAATADLFAPPPSESGEPAKVADAARPPLRSAATMRQTRDSSSASALGVRHLEARGDVTVELEGQGLVLLGRHLVADDSGRQVELFGDDEQPARAVAAGHVLAGEHLLLDEATSRLHVLGPGTLTLKELASISFTPSGEADAATPAPVGDRLHVAWRDTMHYDHNAAQATFAGDVRLVAADADAHTELRSGHLSMDLRELPDGSRTVRTATARSSLQDSEVVFVNQRYGSARTGTGMDGERPLDSRLRLAGPALTFDDALQQVQVLGPGSLLVEDYQPTSSVRPTDDATDQPLVTLRGRGVTLLTWTGQMTLDAHHNDLRTSGDVVMDHVPASADQTAGAPDSGVHLNCQRLVADLQETDGLPGWLSDNPPQPEIRGLYADRQVRVIAGGRTYLADRMAYTGGDQIVVLRGEIDGRGVAEIREGDGRNLTARLVRWNLGDNTYEVVQPGPTRLPVR